MLARIRKARENEGGFTLIELLVVMIIIGILAAIAIPVFLSQRAKAQDTAAKADVSTIGKELATYFVDAADGGTVTVTAVSGRYVLNGDDGVTSSPVVNQDLGKVSNNVRLSASVDLNQSDAWCVAVVNDKGQKAKDGYQYSSTSGLSEGNCGVAVPAP